MPSEPIALEIPAGFYANGTPLQSRGRWRDGNLIRWQEGALLPQGGWARRKKDNLDLTAGGVARAAYVWRDNDVVIRLAVGTHRRLYAFENARDKTDITPTGFIGGRISSAVADGYGMGDYGR